ncbi:hypothetical protein GCM10017620_26200 [Brevundimonas intermedia]|uniref:Uncharacterized protein n=1 Tax=Brevundimonas intermedia TaxID=74315 RepID=A0ABQ5TBX1_9CAUL|nr:hypothetical protein [Brevundimonas intermedia]GLK49647.1 hypothetical protein GCM10017620_26200 [Brevundimonas intermedia]
MTIAKRAGMNDVEQARQALLRLRHEWKALSQTLDGQTYALLNDLDALERSIAKIDLGDGQ